MKFSVLKVITEFKTIQEEGKDAVDVTSRAEEILAPTTDLYTAYSVFRSSKASLEESVPQRALPSFVMVLHVEYEAQDGFVMTRDLVPTSFAKLEKTLQKDIRFATNQAMLASIASSLMTIAETVKPNSTKHSSEIKIAGDSNAN